MEDNLFRDLILIKSDLYDIYQRNKIIGFIYKFFYLYKIKRLLSNLKDNPIDIPLLKGFYEFLKLTRINLEEEYKEVYKVTLYSTLNTINIVINSEINFTISIFMEKNISIVYSNNNRRFVYDVTNNLSNFDNKDKEKSNILNSIIEKISDIIIFSVISYFKRERI